VRNAIAYLVKFSQIDQRYSLPISLKSRLGNDFKDGRKLKDWATWRVDVPKELFPNQYFVRLRGFALYVVHERARGVWLGIVKAPEKSFFEHYSRPGQPVERVDVDQASVPPALSGRITNRDYIRPPDVIGATSLRNIAPFTPGGDNKWTVKLYGASSQGEGTDDVQDLILELHLAASLVGQ
jgi:hypothetical protein